MWKRNCRCLAFLTIITFIALTSIAQAQTIDMDYPENIKVNEEFEVKLSLNEFAEGDYDVKIDVLQNDKRIAKIFDSSTGNFKSTYYFLAKAIESGEKSKDFKLKMESSEEKSAYIVVKIRDSSGKTKTFEGYEINVEYDSGESIEEEKEEEIVEEKNAENKDKDDDKEEIIKETNAPINIAQNNVKTIDKQEVIYLSPQSINNDSEIIFQSKNAKIAHYAIYGFALFCIFLMILLIIDKR